MEAILLPPHRIASQVGTVAGAAVGVGAGAGDGEEPNHVAIAWGLRSALRLFYSVLACGARDSVNLVIFHDVLIMQQQPQLVVVFTGYPVMVA